MVMFEIIGTFVVLTILFFVTGGHKNKPTTGKYSKDSIKNFLRLVIEIIW